MLPFLYIELIFLKKDSFLDGDHLFAQCNFNFCTLKLADIIRKE